MRLLNDIRFFALAFWLGMAVFFSFVVAPSVFHVLRQFDLANANEIAGTIVTTTLGVVNITGFLVALSLMLLTSFMFSSFKKSWIIVQLILFAVMAVTTGLGHWLIAAKMRAIRGALELPIDQIAAHDPRRMAFDNLHHYSVMMLGVAMLGAIISLLLIRGRPVKQI